MPSVQAAPSGSGLGAFVDQDVSNLAGQIRAASTVDELNALQAFVADLQRAYAANDEGDSVVTLDWFQVATRQKRSGPNPAGLTAWPQSLARAESLAQGAALRVWMTPHERARDQDTLNQRILD